MMWAFVLTSELLCIILAHTLLGIALAGHSLLGAVYSRPQLGHVGINPFFPVCNIFYWSMCRIWALTGDDRSRVEDVGCSMQLE